MKKKRILLIVTGSIAAYKALDLLSLLTKESPTKVKELIDGKILDEAGGTNRTYQKNNYSISVLITNSALEFVTPLSFSSLGATIIKNDLFDIEQESRMGHIQLS